MRQILAAGAGVISGFAFVLLVGYTEMRISAAQDGVTLDVLSNDITRVVGPTRPSARSSAWR
ncbi:MAG: hypothetical protein CMH34_09205 [Microbacterium sp.]|nr:hypothetical protein [Microbacterium sp.]|tara:strand:+ start:2437 stop:2622 length:186 start_codon:yes stop_codon:yes gene_type:complete